MKNLILILCLLSSTALSAVVSQPTSGFIETNGAFMQVWITNVLLGIPVAGTYTNFDGGFVWGIASNSFVAPSSRKLVNPYVTVDLVSPGFDQTGTSNVVGRRIYGTRELRMPVPNQLNCDVTAFAGGVIVRLALSDYVFSTDTSITATINAGWYSNSVAGSFTVTNSSTLKYIAARVIGNWTWPDFDMIRASTFNLRWTGGQWFGRNGSPVACVVFKSHDAHTHTNTVTVMAPTIDRNVGDARPVLEWVGNMDASTFTDGDTITNDFKAYPWVGDTTSVLDSSTTGWGGGTPFPHSQAWVLNKANAFTKATAVVSASGNDSTGVTIKTNLDTSNFPAPYLTIAGAAVAIKGTNNITSGGANNTCAGGTIYLVNSIGYTSVPDDAMLTYLWLCTYPTNANPVAITNGPGSGRTGSLLCFSNVTIAANVSFPFFNHKGYWNCHNVLNTSSSAASLFDRGIMYYTDCVISNLDQGFLAAEAAQQPVHLIRGCTMCNMGSGFNLHTVVGNYCTKSATIGGVFMSTSVSGQLYEPDYTVIAFNELVNITSTSGGPFVFWGGTEMLTNGAWICQNVFEQAGGAGATWGLHSDGSTSHITNCMVWHNVIMGHWDNFFYNDTGSAPAYNILCQEKNNIYQSRHIKSDSFTGVTNAARVGNWPVMWQVGSSGNADMQKTNITVSGGFAPEFCGLNSFNPLFIPNSSTYWNSLQGSPNYDLFVTNGAYNGATGAGLGNYRLQTGSSFVFDWRGDWILPFDLEGNARGLSDPPGAYSSSNPRKGCFF